MSDNLATNDQLSDTLLVFDKEKMKIQAVKKLEKNGQMETITPTKKNQNQFLRIDRNGDFVSNFFTNFLEQLKNPTNFLFFKVPTPTAINKAKEGSTLVLFANLTVFWHISNNLAGLFCSFPFHQGVLTTL